MRDYLRAALIGACIGVSGLYLVSGAFVKHAPTAEFEGMDSDDVYFHFRMEDISREIRGLPRASEKLTELYDQAVSLQCLQVLVDKGGTFFLYGALTGMGILWVQKYRKQAQASDTGEW